MATCSFTITLLPPITSSFATAENRSTLNTKNITALSPNPTSSLLYLKNAEELLINAIAVYNINGQLELETNDINKSSFTLSVDGLSKGLHLIKVIHENGKIEVSKIVVQ